MEDSLQSHKHRSLFTEALIQSGSDYMGRVVVVAVTGSEPVGISGESKVKVLHLHIILQVFQVHKLHGTLMIITK